MDVQARPARVVITNYRQGDLEVAVECQDPDGFWFVVHARAAHWSAVPWEVTNLAHQASDLVDAFLR